MWLPSFTFSELGPSEKETWEFPGGSALITAVPKVHYLAWEFRHDPGAAKKKKADKVQVPFKNDEEELTKKNIFTRKPDASIWYLANCLPEKTQDLLFRC